MTNIGLKVVTIFNKTNIIFDNMWHHVYFLTSFDLEFIITQIV